MYLYKRTFQPKVPPVTFTFIFIMLMYVFLSCSFLYISVIFYEALWAVVAVAKC